MQLLYTLECISALSALGERACGNIVQVTGLVGQLVALVTVETQSYSPDGCLPMRLVETEGGARSGSCPSASVRHGEHPVAHTGKTDTADLRCRRSTVRPIRWRTASPSTRRMHRLPLLSC